MQLLELQPNSVELGAGGLGTTIRPNPDEYQMTCSRATVCPVALDKLERLLVCLDVVGELDDI